MSGKTEYKNQWQKENADRVNLVIPKGQKEAIQAHAEAQGETVNGFINRAISETIQREGGDLPMSEASIRQQLKRMGYKLTKSRKGISLDNLGGYMIVDVRESYNGYVVAGAKYELTLDDVMDWIKEIQTD